MSLKLYMDEHVHGAVTRGLRQRGIDVLTVQEDGWEGCNDADLLDRASALSRIMFTQDADFLREAVGRQKRGESFAGVIYLHQQRLTIGQCIEELEILATLSDACEYVNRIEHLPI